MGEMKEAPNSPPPPPQPHKGFSLLMAKMASPGPKRFQTSLCLVHPTAIQTQLPGAPLLQANPYSSSENTPNESEGKRLEKVLTEGPRSRVRRALAK